MSVGRHDDHRLGFGRRDQIVQEELCIAAPLRVFRRPCGIIVATAVVQVKDWVPGAGVAVIIRRQVDVHSAIDALVVFVGRLLHFAVRDFGLRVEGRVRVSGQRRQDRQWADARFGRVQNWAAGCAWRGRLSQNAGS